MAFTQKIKNRYRKEYAHVYAFLFVYLPRIPYVFQQIWHIGSGAWEKQHGCRLGGFGPIDAGFRSWYAKIARDYKVRGRFGYAWDDGLGMALGPRCYNSWVTYWLLRKLGPARYCAAGHLLMILTVAGVTWLFSGPGWGLVAGSICAVSPLIITYFTHVGKTEILWWPVALAALALLFDGSYAAAGLLWSLLAFCSLSCALTVVLYCGIFVLFRSIGDGQFIPLALGLLPGCLKVLFRLFFMYRSGFMAAIAQEQTGLWRRPYLPGMGELYDMLPFTASMVCAWWVSGDSVMLLALFNVLALSWANWRILYHNDQQSIVLCLFCVSLPACLYAGTVLGLLFVCWQIFPPLATLPLPLNRSSLSVESFPEHEGTLARQFPCFSPVGRDYLPEGLKAFFAVIPDGSRILTEFIGDPRSGNPLRALWNWLDYTLPERRIDLVNEEYTRFTNRDLSQKVLAAFHPAGMDNSQMLATVRALGVSHVIAHSSEMVAALKQAGFCLITQLKTDEVKEEAAFLGAPPCLFFLLQAPGDPALIEGVSEFRCFGSALYWNGKAGQTYRIRYRFDSSFTARQNDKNVPLGSYRPFTDIDTRFMELTAPEGGEIMLWFRPFPLWMPDWVCCGFSKNSTS